MVGGERDFIRYQPGKDIFMNYQGGGSDENNIETENSVYLPTLWQK